MRSAIVLVLVTAFYASVKYVDSSSLGYELRATNFEQSINANIEAIRASEASVKYKQKRQAAANYSWVPWLAHKAIPRGAVLSTTGDDSVYVARVEHNGDTIIGKAYPPFNQCYFPSGESEVYYSQCEVLTGSGFSWVKYTGGALPADAFPGGRKANGDLLYVGRVGYYEEENNVMTPNTGTIDGGSNTLSIPYGGKAHKYHKFDVLVLDI